MTIEHERSVFVRSFEVGRSFSCQERLALPTFVVNLGLIPIDTKRVVGEDIQEEARMNLKGRWQAGGRCPPASRYHAQNALIIFHVHKNFTCSLYNLV